MTISQKSIAASIVLALAVVQLIAVSLGRGWIGGLPRERRRLALMWHRGEGYITFTLMVVIAYYCSRLFPGSETPRVFVHALLGVAGLGLVLAKIMIVRVFTRLYSWMPYLGAALFVDVVALWVTSAGWYYTTQGGY